MSYDLESLGIINALLETEGIGPQRIIALLKNFDNPTDILETEKISISKIEGFSETLANRILASLKNKNELQSEFETQLEQLEKSNIKLITYWDEDYPKPLKNIYYPPIFLYLKGELKKSDEIAIAVVGTRTPTNYGKEIAKEFASEISKSNTTVVSGMARGIDSIAHTAALDNGGRTIAVIGSGLDIIYPPENKKLFERIIENGCVVSEFKLGTQPDAQNFPRRNRIISGLSKGVVIIETRAIGGAMQTANHALDQGREVYAVPGNIHSKNSEGTNLLIQQGNAQLVLSAKEVLKDLKIETSEIKIEQRKNSFDNLTLFEQKIIDIFNGEKLQIDLIAEKTSMNVADCLVSLLTLEFKGFIRQLPGKYFEVIY